MALKNTTLIRFPRCEYIASSRQVAMIHLTEDFTHVIGQPVVVGYYKDQDHTEIDTIVAMGVKNGKGKDCFKVVTTGQFIIVWDIVYSLPDVSSLVHGEIYLYKNLREKKWYTVSLNETSMGRDIEEITEDPKFYIRLTDNTIWVSDEDLEVRPLSSIYTKKEIDDIIKQIKIDTDFSIIEERLNLAIEKSVYASEKVDELEERIDHIEEGSTALKAIASLHNSVSINLERVYGEPSSKVWYGKNDTRVFEVDSLEFSLIYHDYSEGDITTGFEEVTMAIGDEPETVIEPNQDGYYTNPMSIILPQGRDLEIPITVSVTYNGTKKYEVFELYGICESRYYGRVRDIENEIDLTELVKEDYSLRRDETYTWGALKSKSGLTIDSCSDLGYFVILYPSAWGELSKISSDDLIYYTGQRDTLGISTFTKKTITLNDTNFLCYYYRNENRDEANNVNLV